MKVLRYPPSCETWSLKTYCNGWGHGNKGCGARLKVFREDLRYKPSDDGDIGQVTFKCVCCGTLTDIGMNDWPSKHKALSPYEPEWYDVKASNT